MLGQGYGSAGEHRFHKPEALVSIFSTPKQKSLTDNGPFSKLLKEINFNSPLLWKEEVKVDQLITYKAIPPTADSTQTLTLLHWGANLAPFWPLENILISPVSYSPQLEGDPR